MSSGGVSAVRQLIKMIKEFEELKYYLTADEFARKKSAEGLKPLAEELIKDFVQIMRHSGFFELLAENFFRRYGLKGFSKEAVWVLMYLVVFCLGEKSCAEITEIFSNLGYKNSVQLAEYFTDEENLVATAQAGCKVFDNDYVLKEILDPLLGKAELVGRLLEGTAEAQALVKKEPQKARHTKPQGPSLLDRVKERPASPRPRSPRPRSGRFKGSQVPNQVYTGDTVLEKKLTKACDANRQKAIELLKRAQEEAFSCASRPSKIPVRTAEPASEPAPPPFKAAKPPPKREVTFKSNAAAVMREAATLEREQEEECRAIERVLEGGFDVSEIVALEREIRDAEERQCQQEIEKKHLLGLITREQAKAAKKRAAQANRDKFEQFKIEEVALMREFDEWREQECLRIKASVEKIQNVERSVKEAERKLRVTKQRNARLIQQESKKMLQEVLEERERDFKRKTDLIAEIRTLRHVGEALFTKKKFFDPAESANLGLLCEMSIAELQERLALLKMEVDKEILEKKRLINDSKGRQKQAMDDMKLFIVETRKSRTAATKVAPTRTNQKLESNSDIVALREKLREIKRENSSGVNAMMTTTTTT